MSWAEYVKRIAGDDLNRVVAERAGVTEPNVSRWKAGGVKPAPAAAAAFARAYRRPVLEAFVAADFLSEADARVRPVAAPSLDSLTDEQLVEEILARMRRGGGGDAGSAAPMNDPGAGPELRVVARDVGRKSDGQQTRDAIENVGEDDQDPGGYDPA